MQRPYEVLEFLPFGSSGSALADVDDVHADGVEWRESSRGLILPGAKWKEHALALAREDAPVNDKDSRGRPISWMGPHTHMLPTLQEHGAPKSYDQWCVLDLEGNRQKRISTQKKAYDKWWNTSQLVKEAPTLTLPRKVNGKGFVMVVKKWFKTAGENRDLKRLKSLSSLHSGAGRQILAEAIASCSAPAALVVDAVEYLTTGEVEPLEADKKKEGDPNALAHVLVSALHAVPEAAAATGGSEKKCQYAGRPNGAEQMATLLAVTLARSSENEAVDGVDGSYGLGAPHHGTEAASGLALLRLLMKALAAVKLACPVDWAACDLNTVQGHAADFLGRRVAALQPEDGSDPPTPTKRQRNEDREKGRGLVVAVDLLGALSDGWFVDEQHRGSVREIIALLAKCGELGTATTLAAEVDKINASDNDEKTALLNVCKDLGSGQHKSASKKLKMVLDSSPLPQIASATPDTTERESFDEYELASPPVWVAADDMDGIEAAHAALRALLVGSEDQMWVGIDTEWGQIADEAGQDAPPAVIQLAARDCTVSETGGGSIRSWVVDSSNPSVALKALIRWLFEW